MRGVGGGPIDHDAHNFCLGAGWQKYIAWVVEAEAGRWGKCVRQDKDLFGLKPEWAVNKDV